MGSFCPRCDDWVVTSDPHEKCPGPPWLNDVAIPGYDVMHVRISGLEPHVKEVLARLAGQRQGDPRE